MSAIPIVGIEGELCYMFSARIAGRSATTNRARRFDMMRKSLICLVTGIWIALVSGGLTLAHAAQFQNPIQAAKDAYNKAKQDAQQQKQQQQQKPQSSGQPPNGASTQSGSASTADCCGPEAMKKVADSLGFIDIVGIKLGMTPAQAVAAVKAYNPNLKIETLTARLEHPSGTPGNFVRVPMTIKAFTPNVRQDLGPVEWIAMEFTMPPGHPLLAKVQRFTGFLYTEPVTASTLLQSLRKKYGQENYTSTTTGWVYDSNGKLLTRVSNLQGICAGDGWASGVPGGGLGPAPPPGETGVGINLSNTTDPENRELLTVPEAGPDCMPLVWVGASGVGEDVAPNTQQHSMTVMMESGALMYMSRKATHAWLQAEADAKTKHDDNAAAGRSAPKL
jgi:hypothetical protein